MEKEFVSYELSLALKEIGYQSPKPIGGYRGGAVFYYDKGSELFYDGLPMYSSSYHEGQIIAPLYQQAFRWFREKYNLMFQIFYLRNGNHAVIIHKTTPEYMDLVDQLRLSSGCVAEVPDCYSYEEAELECLKKLIEIVKEK